jgi:hypothetical protein
MDENEWLAIGAAVLGAVIGAVLGLGLLVYFGGLTYVR